MTTITELYNHLKTLCRQWFYTKIETNNLLNQKSDLNHSHDEKYFVKSQVYNRSETDLVISNAIGNLELVKVVNELPTININTKVLYFLPNSNATSSNKFDIYVRVNGAWEQVDSLNISLENYYKKNEVNNLLITKSDVSHNHDERYYTESDIDEYVLSLRNYELYQLNSSIDILYNDLFIEVVVHQLSNVGSGDLPKSYVFTIPSKYVPMYAVTVPVYNMKNGVPFGHIRLNKNGELTLFVTQPTYTASGGTTVYGTLFYPRKPAIPPIVILCDSLDLFNSGQLVTLAGKTGITGNNMYLKNPISLPVGCSIEFDVYQSNNNSSYIDIHLGANNSVHSMIGVNSVGKFEFYKGFSGNWSINSVSPFSIPRNQWVHVKYFIDENGLFTVEYNGQSYSKELEVNNVLTYLNIPSNSSAIRNIIITEL